MDGARGTATGDDAAALRAVVEQILGAAVPASHPADRDGRLVCAGCGVGHPIVTDLRPWPPTPFASHRYCGACRLARAIAGRV